LETKYIPTVGGRWNIVFFFEWFWKELADLDIYATRDTFGTFTDPVNMGAPYNSSDDDFGVDCRY
jgi:hypothetical protein